MVADVLDDVQSGKLDCRLAQLDTGEIDAGGRSAVCLAPLLVEFAAANGPELVVHNLRHGFYLVAHAARLADSGTHLALDGLGDELCDVSICTGKDDYAEDRRRVAEAVEHGLDVDDEAFERVYAHSRAVLVPQTEESLLQEQTRTILSRSLRPTTPLSCTKDHGSTCR